MIYRFSTSEKIRLDDYLRRELPLQVSQSTDQQEGAFSNSKIRRLIVAGSVAVNGQQCRRPAFELRGKSLVTVEFDSQKFFFEKQPDDIKFDVGQDDVLFEDEFIICVNKPSHFPTEETIVGGEKRDNLHDAVVRYLWAKNPSLRNPPYAGIMHRLDRDTSGVILFTKQRSVNKDIQNMFETHDFTKKYLALSTACGGEKQINSLFTVEMYMNRINSKTQAAKWGSVSQEKGGLYSKTDFKIIKKTECCGKKAFLIEADLYTGRTHQIRVHLSSRGLPIVGDELYGGIEGERIMLHAQSLEFCHPVTKTMLKIEAKCPFNI